MLCPNCGTANADSAKFCKNCGVRLGFQDAVDKTVQSSNDSNSNSNSNYSQRSSSQNNYIQSSNGDNKRIILICATIIVCIVIIAATFVMISNNNSNQNNVGNGLDNSNNAVSLSSSDGSVSDSSSNEDASDSSSNEGSSTSVSKGNSNPDSDIYIKYCDFYTGNSLSDKSYCSANIGTEHTGEKYKISVLYSNSGSNLNDGVSASKTVDEEGFLHIYTSNAFSVYPDKAVVTIYDSKGKFLTEETYYLQETSGQQKFGH